MDTVSIVVSLLSFQLASADLLYVRPSNETPCLAEPCYLLPQVLQNAAEYLVSNTTVFVMPGHYEVNEAVVISDVSNVTIMGSESENTTIQCNGQFTLFVSNVSGIVISSLDFNWNARNQWTQSVLVVFDSCMTLMDTSFTNSVGRCISVYNSNLKFEGNTEFKGIKCYSGCGIHAADNTNVLFNGNTVFEENEADYYGSSILAYNRSSLKFIGAVLFRNNKCSSGCGVYALDHINISLKGSMIFEGNEASTGSGISASSYDNIEFHGTVKFRNNSCTGGCGIYAVDHINICFNGSVIVDGNEAVLGSGIYAGSGGVSIEFLGTTEFQSNRCTDGCGIYAHACTNISFNGHSTIFVGNRGGSGISVHNSSNIHFLGTTVFANNSCIIGCGIHISTYTNVSFDASVTFEDNRSYLYGGAAAVIDSTLKFNGRAAFHGNQALYGGALYLVTDMNPALLLNSSAEISIAANYASEYGGGINIESLPSPSLSLQLTEKVFVAQFITPGICFYHCLDELACPNLQLVNNSAKLAGHAIYGRTLQCYNPIEDDFTILPFQNKSDLSLVASDQTRVCICVDNTPNCSVVSRNITLYPGETFEIPVVAVGDSLGTTTGATLAVIPSSASLGETQISQAVQGPSCAKMTYTMYSDPGMVTMKLVSNRAQVVVFDESDAKIFANSMSYADVNVLPIFVHLSLLPCPIGFQLENRTCICNQALQDNGIFDCSIDGQTIYRPQPFWISTSSSTAAGIILHQQCPLDYCEPYGLRIELNYSDQQCQFNRSGMLCGGCKANLSMVFGSSHCLRCSHWWLFLIPLFALSGIILVFLLTVMNLTVSTGTVNGVIFYANIVRANQAVFFPHIHNTAVKIMSVIIAWLNLDLGIDACFYNGLDAYAKTWLQLVFPVYVWLMMIVIIISSHYFTWAARLSGRNAVPVLATLFLLSYAKLLRFIIATFSFTTLTTYQSGNTSVDYVWLYDGNVEFLKGKHIFLFSVAVIILVTLSGPYTLVLLVVQHLQRKSQHKMLLWLRKLKPLFDAYTGPHKDKHRYWTGLLLLVRVGLFLFFSIIQSVVNEPSLGLLAIIFTTLSLLALHGMVGGVYKLVSSNFLEYFFLVNLAGFAGATLYTTVTGTNQAAVVCVSVGLTFAVFVAIFARNAYRKLKDSKCMPNKPQFTYLPVEDEMVSEDHTESHVQGHVTSQILFFNELREPVMEFYEGN